MTNAYDIVTHDGKRVDALTKAAIVEAEKRLGYELSITQGSYNAGAVSASAGTHDGGGVIDLRAWDWPNKVRVLRDVGFAAWYRDPSEGPWPAHIHAVLIGNERLAPSAARQVEAYYAGRNGLANYGPDTFNYRPSPIPVFRWAPERQTRGAHVDAALRHIDRAVKNAEGDRRAALNRARRAIRRNLAGRTTNRAFKHLTGAHVKRGDTRGLHVDNAIRHLNRAIAASLTRPRRFKALTEARAALRSLPTRKRR